jgi:hypothetical protein
MSQTILPTSPDKLKLMCTQCRRRLIGAPLGSSGKCSDYGNTIVKQGCSPPGDATQTVARRSSADSCLPHYAAHQPISKDIKQTPWPWSASELYRPSDRHSSATLVPTFADRGCRVVSATDPHDSILGFLDRTKATEFFFLEQVYSLWRRNNVLPQLEAQPQLTVSSSYSSL